MEMHLLCETMFTCRKNNILPVHLCILLDDVIHKEKVKAIEGMYFLKKSLYIRNGQK